jgi:hypothetical protein
VQGYVLISVQLVAVLHTTWILVVKCLNHGIRVRSFKNLKFVLFFSIVTRDIWLGLIWPGARRNTTCVLNNQIETKDRCCSESYSGEDECDEARAISDNQRTNDQGVNTNPNSQDQR